MKTILAQHAPATRGADRRVFLKSAFVSGLGLVSVTLPVYSFASIPQAIRGARPCQLPARPGGKSMNLVLEPKTTALVLIDLEHSIVSSAAPQAADVIKNAVLLSKALRQAGGTIIFTRVLSAEMLNQKVDIPAPKNSDPPANASDLVPELDRQPGDLVVTKRQWGAFYGTDMEQQLQRRGIRTLIMGGIATNMGVESTARDAFDRGYDLIFAEDAMAGISPAAEEFAVKTLFPLMGRVRSTDQIIKALP